MIRYSWFRLILRLVGVLLIGLSLPSSGTLLAAMIYRWANPTTGGMDVPWLTIEYLPAAAQAGLGFYLLFGGGWIAQRCLRGIDTVCPACGYDVADAAITVCPECGLRIRPVHAASDGDET